MSLVRTHIILEKFTDESDPIADMGIGLMQEIREFCKSKMKDTDFYGGLNEKDRSLIVCVNFNKYRYIKYLLDHGANINVTFVGYNGDIIEIPIRHAIYNDNNSIKMIDFLIKHGANIEKAFFSHEFPILNSNLDKRVKQHVKKLLKKPKI